jgi:hypothetical protein
MNGGDDAEQLSSTRAAATRNVPRRLRAVDSA